MSDSIPNSNSKASSSAQSNANNVKKQSKQSSPMAKKGKGKQKRVRAAMIKCKTFVFKPSGNGIVNFAYNLLLDEELVKEAEEAFKEGTRTDGNESNGAMVIVDRKQTQTTTTSSQTTSTLASASVSTQDPNVNAMIQRKNKLESIAEEVSETSISPIIKPQVCKTYIDGEGKKVYEVAPGVIIKTYLGKEGKLVYEETTPGAVAYIRNLKEFKGNDGSPVRLIPPRIINNDKKIVENGEEDAKESNFGKRANFRDEKGPESSSSVDFSQYKRVRRS